MNYSIASTNPFYASRLKRAAPRTEEPNRPIYARLPLAPRNASPVPHLTSLYHFHRAGDYGDRQWPGNCGGNLIKDLLNYFQSEGVSVRPNVRLRHLPRRVRGARHPVLRLGHSSETSTPAIPRSSRKRKRSNSSGLIHLISGRSSMPMIREICHDHPRSSISSAGTANSSGIVPVL